MLFIYTLLLAVAAFTYSEVLTPPGEALCRPYDWLEKHLPEYLFKPVIGCSKCVAGQWALFLYVLYFSNGYDLVTHVWFVLQSVFNAAVIRAVYYKITTDKCN